MAVFGIFLFGKLKNHKRFLILSSITIDTFMEEKGIDYSNLVKQSLMREFWDKFWRKNKTGWDIGQASPPISKYIKQYKNKEDAILIPGCGNAYEAELLVKENFTNITLIDISPKAVNNLKERFKDNKNIRIICSDFFSHQGKYDLIIEQTFFCAIGPEKRMQYASHTSELLNKNGKIIGLFFSENFEKEGPPFGGIQSEYETIFKPYYNFIKLEESYNSIPPRQGRELFFIFKKKSI